MGMMVPKVSLSFGYRKGREVKARPHVLDHQTSTDSKLNQRAISRNMRIAIAGRAVVHEIRIAAYMIRTAGTSGLSLLIAQEINNSTSHQLVILSRTVCIPV